MAGRRQANDVAGAPSVAHIPHSRPFMTAAESAAVADVLDSGQLAQGPRTAALEAAMATFFDIGPGTHAVGLSSGTAALFVALRALDVGPGDEVLIPAFACTSLHQAVVFTGATPCFVDCDPRSFNPDPEDARRKTTAKTAACIVPHLFGLPADIDEFVALGVPVVEDCAQTLGVPLDNRPVGTFGDIAICSFYATKLVAGGEGGMLLAADEGLASRARRLRDCEMDDSLADSFNFKMSDVHAAIATVQLHRLVELLRLRRDIARQYSDALADLGITLPAADARRRHAWFRYVVNVDATDLDDLISRCEAHGIDCRRPVGRLAGGVDLDDLPGCREAWHQACSIPLFPAMTEAETTAAPARFAAALGDARE